ncbi:MAG: MFS transporter [Propioniciclava sp.]|uniref:MFS transporter n=1 Tax=Propioniciclava sp. TaxID=2038686 RepID=UPI0039E58D08
MSTSFTAVSASANRTPWGTVGMFAAAGFFTMTTSLMTAGLLPAMAREFGVPTGVAGTLTSVFALAIVVTVLPGTRWSMRFTRRAVVVATVLALIVSNLIVAASGSLPVALAGRFLGGASHGLLVSTMPAIVARIVPPRDAPKAMGIALAGNSAGLAVGAPLTAVLAGTVGWRGSFVIAAGFGVVVAVALFFLVPVFRVDPEDSGSVRDAVRTPGVLRMAASWATVLLGHYAVLTFVAPVFLNAGGTEETVGLPLMVLGVAGIVGVLAGGRLRPARVFTGAIATSSLVALAFVVLWLHPPMPVVYALLVVWGAGSSASLLLNQQCVLLAGFRTPELAMSLGVLITQFGVALGSSLGGLTLQTLGPSTVPLAGALAIVAALLMLPGMRAILTRALAERTVAETSETPTR